MDNRPFIAHIADDGRIQSIDEHLCGTSELSGKFAEVFDAREPGEFIGAYHDIGKYSIPYKKRIYENGAMCDHSTASAYELFLLSYRYKNEDWFDEDSYLALGNIMASHHSGLMDRGESYSSSGDGNYIGRLKKGHDNKIPEYKKNWNGKMEALPDIPKFDKKDPFQSFQKYLYYKFLYSCLTDADFLDTKAFMSGETNQGHDSIKQLLDRLEKYLDDHFSQPIDNLGCIRNEISGCCREEAGNERGVFSLTVPTGGGKTLSSLLFALRHAVANGMDRVIYVIPYTSIIEQNAAVLKTVLGNDNVLEHHSNVDELDSKENGGVGASENWDAPVIVTTTVQFFESLFGHRPSVCRKIHNMANSVIIFDEVQQLPVEKWKLCTMTMASLVKRFRSSIVLCTATQPGLSSMISKLGCEITDIVPGKYMEEEVFDRVTIRNLGYSSNGYQEMTPEEIAGELEGQQQALCIVNSRKAAFDVYSCLEPNGAFHLSTLVCAEDRAETLRKIRKALLSGKKCLVVSTSLIEAGVDISFPAVYREACGLDSVLQAAGRCNREGKSRKEDSIVSIFKGNWNVPGNIKDRAGITERVTRRKHPSEYFSKSCIDGYFRELFSLTAENSAKHKKSDNQIYEWIRKFPTDYYKSISEKFYMINNNMKTVYIPSQGCLHEIECLMAGKITKGVLRKLGPRSVSISRSHYKKLIEIGYIEPCRYLDGAAVLINEKGYNKTTGLVFDGETDDGIFV